MREPVLLPAGTQLAERYTLKSCLGHGAFGAVYKASDRYRDEPVALKVIRHKSPTLASSLQREVMVLRFLRLPGVVHLLDERLADVRPFLVMPLVDGFPFPGRAVPSAWQRIDQTAIALAESLARVHAAGIVHRDLKPSNVLVDDRGVPHLLDFGIAHGAEWTYIENQSLGTPAYLSPEQARGKLGDERADMYAFGTMLFEALSGRLPFDEGNVQRLLAAKSSASPRSLADLGVDVPEGVAELVDELLAPRPEDRPASMGDVASRLRGNADDSTRDLLVAHLGEVERVGVDDLAPVFIGIEWMAEERTRAAEQLLRRTGPRLSNVADGVARWVRAGRAYWEGGRLRMVPTQLRALELSADFDRSAPGFGTTDIGAPSVASADETLDVTAAWVETLRASERSEVVGATMTSLASSAPLALAAAHAFYDVGDFEAAGETAFAAAREFADTGQDEELQAALTIAADCALFTKHLAHQLDAAIYRFDALGHELASRMPARELLVGQRSLYTGDRERALEVATRLEGKLSGSLETHRVGLRLRNLLRLSDDERFVAQEFQLALSRARVGSVRWVRASTWLAALHLHYERFSDADACLRRALERARQLWLRRLVHAWGVGVLKECPTGSSVAWWRERFEQEDWSAAPDSFLKALLAYHRADYALGRDVSVPSDDELQMFEVSDLEPVAWLSVAAELWRRGRVQSAIGVAQKMYRRLRELRFHDGAAMLGGFRGCVGDQAISDEALGWCYEQALASPRPRIRANALALLAGARSERFAGEDTLAIVRRSLAELPANQPERIVLLSHEECIRLASGIPLDFSAKHRARSSKEGA